MRPAKQSSLSADRHRLIQKYGVTGPRYTSYPTALSFDDSVGADAYRVAAKQSNDDLIPAPLSLYLHIPFCRSLCYYCGCHKKVTRNAEMVKRYLAALCMEIELKAALFDSDRVVHQLHLGGGTPTFLDAEQRKVLLDKLTESFPMSRSPDRDFAIEIDPRTVSPSDIKQLASLGFNRVSFGVQDLDPKVQHAVNRVYDYDDLRRIVMESRDAGLESICIDLIYGLPHQNLASFRNTLEQIVALGPDTLSVFNYAHLPNMFPAQRLIRAEDLPSASERLEMFEQTVAFLSDQGYDYIGMDHFALPNSHLHRARDEATLYRCFQGYSSHRGADLLGFGVSAISQIGPGYYQQTKDIRGYINRLLNGEIPVDKGYVMDSDDRRRRAVIQSLMCYGKVDKPTWESDFSLEFDDYFASELENLKDLEADGLLSTEPDRIRVSDEGKLFLRNIARGFDVKSGQLPKASAGRGFSRTI